MAHLITKKVNGREYKYLRHTYRDGKDVRAVEMGITRVLQDGMIDDITREAFIQRVFETRWSRYVEMMKANYTKILNDYNPAVEEKFFEDFGIRFTHATNKIEGSRLSFKDTRQVILDDAITGNKQVSDVVEARSHMVVYRDALKAKETFSLALIKKWHEQLFKLSKPRDAGLLRNGTVIITGSKHVPPASRAEVDWHLDKLFTWYTSSHERMHPALVACIVMYRISWIHPFNDGNGRISRLAMNYLLYQAGYPMLNIDPDHRGGYYKALELSDVHEDVLHVLVWFFSRYIGQNKKYLENK